MMPARLSSPLQTLRDRYDIVVVGSGYGGAVAACRLARAGRTVCVLERGREIRPGEYPNDTLSMAGEIQIDLSIKRFGSETALFDLRVYDDINVAIGCALGGTSLINAGIALRPDPRLLQDGRWPRALREEAALVKYFDLAENVLKPTHYPERRARPLKFDALEHAARSLNLPFERAPILVNFDELPNGRNAFDIPQAACVDCGDCVSGCNYGAKNTLLMNYLPHARRHGAEFFTGARVSRVMNEGDGWRVSFNAVGEENGRFPDGEGAVRAAAVVLAAGALGSTEILLRSRAAGLSISAAIGRHFSGNGDMIGLVYNAEGAMNSVGYGAHAPAGRMPVGPTSTGMIDFRRGRDVGEGMVLVDGTIPGAFGHWLPATLGALASAIGTNTEPRLAERIAAHARAVQSNLLGPHTGSIHNTLLCLVVAQDEAAGRIELDGHRVTVRWPGAGDEARLARASEAIRSIAEVLGGTFIPNPSWHPWLGRRPITGHPLGGCAMADDARDGVVNDRGQVFSGESGTAVHRGLYVMDGAVIPRSVGVNPLLTIAAVAERCCDLAINTLT